MGFVHFSEFANAAGWSLEQQRALGNLLGLLSLDPLIGLDPAVKQIEQTRLLAERVIFYMQRMPYLLDLQTQRVVLQATLAPEVKRANASLERATLAMETYAEIGTGLPDAIAREREALIEQLSGEMLRQEAELRGLLTDLQATLATGSETAVAVNAAVDSLDRLVARFRVASRARRRRAVPSTSPSTPPPRPSSPARRASSPNCWKSSGGRARRSPRPWPAVPRRVGRWSTTCSGGPCCWAGC